MAGGSKTSYRVAIIMMTKPKKIKTVMMIATYLKVILFINGGVFIEGSIMGHPQDVL